MTLAINGCFSPWIAVTTGFPAVNSSYNQENSHQLKKGWSLSCVSTTFVQSWTKVLRHFTETNAFKITIIFCV